MLSNFFINRPIFATVLSIVIVLAGLVAIPVLPVSQYPEITPPTVQVTCGYPGANSQTVADTIAAPIEQQVNGVENMLYMSSTSGNDGSYTLTVTFKIGTDINQAQVLVQNRVAIALPQLPDIVKSAGVTTKKSNPSILLAITFFSPDKRYDQLYLSNFATIQVKDEIARIEGVGDVFVFGAKDYSMRSWLNPEEMAARNISATDVIAALREQNTQVAAGTIGQQPSGPELSFQYTMNTKGRLTEAREFGDVVVKSGKDGQLTRLRDIARTQLGARTENVSSFLTGSPACTLAVFQLPGSNALATADAVKAKMKQLKASFPAGVDYVTAYDTTPFVRESIGEVVRTLLEAIVLVGIVVLVFLQNWRATLIPLVAVPVAIVGTFAVMLAIGFSINNLTLFGMVLAIGIVVDDAIVVVEAVEHNIEQGLAPREATIKAMQQVGGPIIAISLVLCAVFIPCAFITGITGQFFRQFAVVIAVSTVISLFNSLTLSPALSALLLRPRAEQRDPLSWVMKLLLGWFFKLFNVVFGAGTAAYVWSVGRLVRVSALVLVVYGGLLFLTGYQFNRAPAGFIPTQDKSYLFVVVQLPDSASLKRTEAVMDKVSAIVKETEGCTYTVGVSGQSLLLNAIGSNFGTTFVGLDEFSKRNKPGLSGPEILAHLEARFQREIPEAFFIVAMPPAVDGLGNSGGFQFLVQDRRSSGYKALEAATGFTSQMFGRAMGSGEFAFLAPVFRSGIPQVYVDVDRTKAKTMNVNLNEIFTSLQVFMGGYYVNDLNLFGRTWQVNIQADEAFRRRVEDVQNIKIRNNAGDMLPLGTVAKVRDNSGPQVVTRYNTYPASPVFGNYAPGVSSGKGIATMERIAGETLPPGMKLEWTELTLLQILAGNTALYVFAFAVIFVFLLLAAQYESWTLPLAVILVVPMCLLSSVTGVLIANMDVNIFTQIGFVVLVGLASKNAILIVEFAKEAQDRDGKSRYEAVLEACRLRLRPILMTSFAFILGVVPLVISHGAGAEMRRTLGTAVFSGMLGVTFFGLFLTPVFYASIRWATDRFKKHPPMRDPVSTAGGELAVASVVAH